MVEVFEEEGVEALKLFCREHFEDEFLYCSGEGKLITHTQYASWRHLQDCKTKEVGKPLRKHPICLQLEFRAAAGSKVSRICVQIGSRLI